MRARLWFDLIVFSCCFNIVLHIFFFFLFFFHHLTCLTKKKMFTDTLTHTSTSALCLGHVCLYEWFCCCWFVCAVRWSQKHFIAFDSLYLLWTLKNVFATHCRFIWCFGNMCVCARLRWALVIRAYSYFYSVLTVYLFIFTFFSVVPFCCFDFFFDFLLSLFYFFS